MEKQGALWFQVVVHLAEKVTGEQAWKERREGAMGVSEREHPGPRTVRARNVCVSWPVALLDKAVLAFQTLSLDMLRHHGLVFLCSKGWMGTLLRSSLTF